MNFLVLRPARAFALFLVVSLMAVLVPRTPAQAGKAQENHIVQVAMKNVQYHFTQDIAVHIVQLQGHLSPTKPGSMVVFDDKNSFVLAMDSSEIAMTCNSLAQVLNQNVFAAKDAPVKAVTMEIKDGQLDIKGKLHSKGDVTFEMTGTLSAEPDGRIRLHAVHVKAAHLPVKGLLDLLGLDLSKLINTKKVQGVAAEKDDLILDPQQILPPPKIQGKVTAVRVQGNEIVQVFGSLQASNFAAKQPGNYMAYHDNDLRFGKLTMNAADMYLIDMDAHDPFDFYLDHYKDQLVAGYTKLTPEFGLRVYMRDFNKLRSSNRTTTARNNHDAGSPR
jgi:hypothetical protein